MLLTTFVLLFSQLKLLSWHSHLELDKSVAYLHRQHQEGQGERSCSSKHGKLGQLEGSEGWASQTESRIWQDGGEQSFKNLFEISLSMPSLLSWDGLSWDVSVFEDWIQLPLRSLEGSIWRGAFLYAELQALFLERLQIRMQVFLTWCRQSSWRWNGECSKMRTEDKDKEGEWFLEFWEIRRLYE